MRHTKSGIEIKTKIEIEFDGSIAKTLVNGKPIHKCSDMEHNFMFNAFECIRKDIERYTKRFIGNSCKWEKQESKRRKYEVHYIEKDFMEGFTILHTIKLI